MMTDDVIQRVPHIGIVAGTSEGAALCYRTVCREGGDVMGQHMHPEVTLHSLPLRFYLDAIDRDDWGGVAGLMSESASKLAQAGADFVICPNNTLHKAIERVESPIPWLHIAKPVVSEIVQHRWRRVGILGTQIVMEGAIYAQRLRQADVSALIPDKDDRARIQHIIRTELVPGVFTSRSRLFLQRVIAGMAAQGAEAVILGCTELPLLISEDRSVLPVLDSTRLLAHAALAHAASRYRSPKAQLETASLNPSLSPIR
jgi:aspartate racemase